MGLSIKCLKASVEKLKQKINEIIEYAYNNEYFQSDNPPKHKQVVNKKHDPYIESIVGGVYYDAGFDKTKKWIIEWLLPLLEKYRIND